MFKKYKVLERFREIEETATFPTSREAKAALEKLDKEMSKLMLTAEKEYAGSYMPIIMISVQGLPKLMSWITSPPPIFSLP